MYLLLAFVAVPLIEIALFIQVGGFIGLWPTLLIVLLTAILGSYLVRKQGAAELSKLRRSFSDLSDPSESLAGGAMILFSGALLLTPGFFTDAVGFALLVPGIRKRVYTAVRSRIKVQSFQMGPQGHPRGHPEHHPPHPRPDDRVIDAEYERIDEPRKPGERPGGRPSGWTQH
ncbi:FxsA family protein [Salipiger sp. IMCC34102]|uniref:FxsA family protein n=1 Tax=Salipiger sp. IMCC34102 TaxID=2510647 RepID=UPI00101B71E0|nr:FxsA family protein [Salipiger sp. IMCC34102]RYH04223.1 FxsA family protein [Salipiger sp. IMCC34102]